MQTMMRTCPACRASVAPGDRFCGECGAPMGPDDATAPIAIERGEIVAAQAAEPSAAPLDGESLALAAAVRVSFGPQWSETPGTLLAGNATLTFFSKDPDALLSVPLTEIADYRSMHVGPVETLQFSVAGERYCFLLRDGGEFHEALGEMLAAGGRSEPTLRLRALSERFAAHAPGIVADEFTVGKLFKSPAAAQSFIRLIGLVTRA